MERWRCGIYIQWTVAAAKSLQSCPTLWDLIDGSHQAPPSLGFSRQEHWSGLPFPSPTHESEKWKAVAQSCLTLSNLMDCSPSASFVHGISQARVLEWVAIAFSTTKCYSVIKKNEIRPFATKRVELKIIILSQIKKDKHHMISLMCGI